MGSLLTKRLAKEIIVDLKVSLILLNFLFYDRYGILGHVMSKETLVFILGILLAAVPFFGIPENWKNIIVGIVGLILIIVGYSLRRALFLSQIDRGNGERGTNSFVETTQTLFDDRTVQ